MVPIKLSVLRLLSFLLTRVTVWQPLWTEGQFISWVHGGFMMQCVSFEDIVKKSGSCIAHFGERSGCSTGIEHRLHIKEILICEH